ncbi:MAG: hypothetical protein JSV79_04865 [Armatimonadota bacterium]|nr:MAG: hypothetical protein JSV79_04865 [Armatimonadota bacterium]
MSPTSRVVFLIAIAAATALGSARGPAAGAYADAGGLREIFRIRLVNDYGGEVSVSRDAGRSWQAVGQVLRYTTKVNRRGFTASKWVSPGRVAAAAVNAIHVSVGYNPEEDRGVVFSVLPREFLAPPAAYHSFLSPNSSIYTDLAAGERIFGGGEAPLVGSSVFLEEGDGSLSALTDGYVPARGDALVIVVALPERYPIAASFENAEGGAVTLEYGDGSQRLLGWVIRPARGIGRFAGSRYAAMGRIRAGHAGVVDVSTSPLGFLGAFQIIPVGHALSPEMGAAWSLTQWMIVGPVAEDSPLWEGLMPLFYQHIRPDYRAGDLRAADWKERLLSRFLVEADFGYGWRPLWAPRLAPDATVPLPDWAHHALEEARRIRILFPLTARGGPREASAFFAGAQEQGTRRGRP